MVQKIAAAVGKPLKYNLTNCHESRPGHDTRYALSMEVNYWEWDSN